MLLPIIHHIRGIPYWAIRLVPNKVGLENQAIDDYKMFCSLYENLHIRVGKDSLTFNEYQQLMSKQFELDNSAECSDLFNDVKRVNKGSRGQINKILDQVYKFQGCALFIVDEPDFGSKFESELHQILNLSKDLHNRQKGDFLIGTTATEKELSNEIHMVHQHGHLYASYCGLNCSGGGLIDPDFPNLPSPKIQSHAQFASKMNLSCDLSIVWPSYYENEMQFDKHVKKQQKVDETGRGEYPHGMYIPVDNHKFYKRMCEAAIVEFLRVSLIENNIPGAAIRFTKSNFILAEFANILRNCPTISNIQVLEYNDGRNQVSFEDFLKRNRDDKSHFVILVTGSFRMGDYIPPKTIGLWLEFCESNSVRAILQGFYGRGCGANKGNPQAVWVANAKTYARLNAYITSKGLITDSPGIRGVKFCERTEIIDVNKKTFRFSRDTRCPVCSNFLVMIESLVAKLPNNKFGSKKFRGDGVNVEKELNHYGKHVLEVHQRKLLGVNDVVDEVVKDVPMKCCMKKKNGLPFFSCYEITSLEDQRGNAMRSDRTVDPRSGKTDKVNPILFHLVWLKRDKIHRKVIVDSIKFRCVSFGVQQEHASNKSLFIDFSAYRRGKQDAQKGVKLEENPHDENKCPTQHAEWIEGYQSFVLGKS
jgi:hypothetical protein